MNIYAGGLNIHYTVHRYIGKCTRVHLAWERAAEAIDDSFSVVDQKMKMFLYPWMVECMK